MVGEKYMGHIDEIIEKIASKNKVNTVLEIFILVGTFTCAIVTNNIWLTYIYTLVTFIFDILAKNSEDFSLVPVINWIFGHKFHVCVFLITLAFSPTLAYGVEKAIDSSGLSFSLIKDIFVERLYNLVPNIFGALIVCSFMFYSSYVGAENILRATIRKEKDFFNIIMRGGFIIAFLNAINHAFRKGYQISECLNALHLTAVVFGGIAVLGAYVLWITDKNDPNMEIKNVYPIFSLVLCWAFLWSCVFIPVKSKNMDVEWLLLFFNGVTSIIVSWVFLFFIRRKFNNKRKKYPYTILIIFTLFVGGIIKYGIKNIRTIDKSSIIIQLISGCTILLGSIVLLYLIDSFQKNNSKYVKKHSAIEKLKEELLIKQNTFIENVENGLESDYYGSSAIKELFMIFELKTKIETLENDWDLVSNCPYYNVEQCLCEKYKDDCIKHEEKCENTNYNQ